MLDKTNAMDVGLLKPGKVVEQKGSNGSDSVDKIGNIDKVMPKQDLGPSSGKEDICRQCDPFRYICENCGFAFQAAKKRYTCPCCGIEQLKLATENDYCEAQYKIEACLMKLFGA